MAQQKGFDSKGVSLPWNFGASQMLSDWIEDKQLEMNLAKNF